MRPRLPSPSTAGIVFAPLVGLLLAACDTEPSPKKTAEPTPNVYLQALQEAEAVKHSVDQRNLEQQRIDALIGRGQAQPPTR